jgi:hypothetical protein
VPLHAKKLRFFQVDIIDQVASVKSGSNVNDPAAGNTSRGAMNVHKKQLTARHHGPDCGPY